MPSVIGRRAYIFLLDVLKGKRNLVGKLTSRIARHQTTMSLHARLQVLCLCEHRSG